MGRIHPPRTCENPNCRVEFFPDDFRMRYCSTGCRVAYHNDQRRLQNTTRFATDGVRRLNDQLLECLYESPNYEENGVPESSLELLCIDQEVGTWEKNLDTGRPILWFYAYGLELVNAEARLFTIHYRTKTKYYA
ncbi:hypothetical protein EPD60_07485 [Flaviaesturariibacter flavus]|uniref:Uncharacterized protein n=1 Tax=Flaviaesturariibacter flavus TaxID=2502780 RepID=A0A4R1BH32_9BACT|nr:hypothetical protein [Flaviaesturariibacter flavus]TCJ16575.1 hypothetical protein EPD60_07485 [Flaviaesturariibacter flavus]